jgi:hypothetical protein
MLLFGQLGDRDSEEVRAVYALGARQLLLRMGKLGGWERN